MAISNWPQLHNNIVIAPNSPVWRTASPVLIAEAKKDSYVRRFFNRDYTTHSDLLGVVTFWLLAGLPRDSLEDFIWSVRPLSGWVEDENYNPSLPQRRKRSDYAGDFSDLVQGYWDKWEKKK